MAASKSTSRDEMANDTDATFGGDFGDEMLVLDPATKPKQLLNANGKKKRKRQRKLVAAAAKEASALLDASKEKYLRGERLRITGVKDKKLKANLKQTEAGMREAATAAARAEILLPEDAGFLETEGPLERTYKVTQQDVSEAVDEETRANMLDLRLGNFGPFAVDYARNGRHMLLGGRKGHIQLHDLLRGKKSCDFHARETVRDVRFLHNHTMFAAAQRKYVYVYDDQGTEIHCLRSHIQPNRLEFLPYHYLLASVGRGGWLKYQDTSTGQLVAEQRTRLGECDCMRQNPYNAVMLLGHACGAVTMWSPSVSKPLVRMLCHRGPVRALAVDSQGRQLVTAGLDGKLSVWDVRTYRKLHSYFTPRPATSVDISQRGLLAVACGYQVQVWKDALCTKASSPYMRHPLPGREVSSVRFRPFEDVLGLGHTNGFVGMVVPGAGEPNFDSYQANPFESRKQRRETEVHGLLEKLQPDMIVLDPNELGTVQRVDRATLEKERKEEEEAAAAAAKAGGKATKERHKARGRGKIGKRVKRKHRNIIDAERLRRQERNKAARGGTADAAVSEDNAATSVPSALSRFVT